MMYITLLLRQDSLNHPYTLPLTGAGLGIS
jgi:hypothetical protein